MCGNGIRCFARYVNDQNMMNEQEFNVETLAQENYGVGSLTFLLQRRYGSAR